MKSGDKIKFGEKYCEKTGREYLLNQTVMLTPQQFEEDNGLYSFTSECPGIYDSEDEESESIYHLFGNQLENIYDCEIIPATEEDLLKIKELQELEQRAIEREYELFAEYHLQNQKE